jgi:uncharacterized protein DUF5667
VDSQAGDQAERFARAVESPTVDPEFEAELAIIAALQDIDLAPDDLARERMRKQVLAKAKPVVSSRRSRFAVALVAALLLVFALAGMSLLLSKDALPGDALYGMKRTTEAASLGLTFGDESKALKHLEFAAARVTEMETLVERHPDVTNAPVGSYLTALTDFDADTSEASRELIALATKGDADQLTSLKTWAGQQNNRLAALDTHLPQAARDRKDVSLLLLARIAERATALLGRADCGQLTTGESDDIGALPASGACHRPTANDSATPATPGTQPSSPSSPKVKTSGPQIPPSAGAPEPKQTPPPASTAPQVPLIPVPVPTLPTRPVDPTLPSLPVPILQLPPLLPGLPAIRIG